MICYLYEPTNELDSGLLSLMLALSGLKHKRINRSAAIRTTGLQFTIIQ